MIGIVDADGCEVGHYAYDAWGNLLSIDGDSPVDVNPLRYRGYVYDTETKLYYLQSRYYSPEQGRLINADLLISANSLLGYNVYIYCGNDPINNIDPSGYILKDICTKAMPHEGASVIYNQHHEPYASKSLGLASVLHGGCGPVAVYNALSILERQDQSFSDVLDYFITGGYTYLGGLLGTSYTGCINYFRDQGYTVYATTKVQAYAELAATADACILYYWFDSNSFVPVAAHFVAFQQIGDIGTYYNVFYDSTREYRFAGDCSDFIVQQGGCLPVLILIYSE